MPDHNVQSKSLAVVEAPQSNVAAYRASTDAANLCREIVTQTAKDIQGRKYVCVEGWQAIAVAHGCAASARSVERVDGGVRAIGEVRRMSDGVVIAEAEGFVGEDEATWYGGTVRAWEWGQKRGEKVWYDKEMPKRPDYAIRAMAQTRAISRACRSAFAHVVVLIDAGLSTTPAEEVPHGGFDDAEYTEVPRESARDRAAREADANGGVHPNNDETFSPSSEALRVEQHIRAATDKADLDLRWRETRTVRDQIKRADAELHETLVAKFADIAKGFAKPSPQADTVLDDDVPF